MIKIFSEADKVFSSNGDVVIQPLKAKVHNEDSEDYYLELEAGLQWADFLSRGNIIVAPTPDFGEQAFRISSPIKTGTKISVKAWHVYYDSENYLIPYANVVDANGNNAINQLNDATEPISPFTVYSDSTLNGSYECTLQSLFDAFETFRGQWGGHLVRDNFNVSFIDSIESDHGITIEYKKNLKEISCEEDDSELCTTLLPVGKDGIMLNSLDPSESIYMRSEIQYDIPYVRSVQFEQDIARESYPSDAEYYQALINDLRAQGSVYLNNYCIPKVNYTLKAHLEKVTGIGDTIEVKDRRLGIDLFTSVIAYEYDCLLGKYTEIEFGNFRPSISGLIPSLYKRINSEVKTATKQIDVDLSGKVDKVDGKGLSSNDFTNSDVTKLNGIEAGANKANIISVSDNAGVVTVGSLLIQWGISTVNGVGSVTFIQSYTFIPDVQICSGDTSTLDISATDVTTSGFNINATGTVRWLAIGRA